ncbi:MAG: hypothetical protein DKINENOH_01702 [bacterium]|nr:hypothetical protein [bacterium]
MANWREKILSEFTPQVARLTLVADPDGLLTEEGIIQGLKEKGFEIIPFEDHVAFRFAYESKYRSRWDRGETTDLVVVLRSATSDLERLPYDLLQAGRKLAFRLGELFPNLSYRVVDALDRSDLEALYRAQEQYKPGELGDNATKDFVLRHVFEIAPELIKQPSDLLRVLLRRHHQAQRIPAILDERLTQILKQNGLFRDWPLEQIMSDRSAFFAFLQERWPRFLERRSEPTENEIHERADDFNLKYAGPAELPFDHDEVRTYVIKLFLEGKLHPIASPQAERLARDWLAVGILTAPDSYRTKRLQGLFESVAAAIPADEARHQEWLAFAPMWAELAALWHDASIAQQKSFQESYTSCQQKIDAAFLAWIQKRYAGLHNQPVPPPAMVHQIPRALARRVEQDHDEKIALVVMDGMALEQWVVLREVLAAQRHKISFREETAFAWIPTITSVSRQAIFAGKPPLYFPLSLATTDRDAYHWRTFWSDHGIPPAEVGYVRGLGEGSLESLEETLSNPKVRIWGMVIDKIDKIMHGMELGAAGMHNQVRQWAQSEYMANFVDLLWQCGFSVFLTSDHGNIEAQGCGYPAEGAIAELRGERVRIYSDENLRNRVKERFPDALDWPSYGLPNEYLPLLAPSRNAFIRAGERVVAHGGISMEELIVPFVQINRRES